MKGLKVYEVLYNNYIMSQDSAHISDYELVGLRFTEAIWTANLPLLQDILTTGTDPNTLTPTGLPPIALACKRGSPMIISALLEHGADPNVEYDDIGPLIYLVTDGSWSPFMEQRWDCVKLLLQAGADVSRVGAKDFTIMEAAWEAGHGEPLVRLMLEIELRPELPSHEVRLISAVKRRQIRLAQSLLALGISPNCRSKTDQAGATPLMLAAAGGDFDMAQLLLAHGALPKMRTHRSRRQDLREPTRRSHFVSESTALEFAVNRGMYRVVQLLLISAGKSTGSPSDQRLVELAQKMQRNDLETLLHDYNYRPDSTLRGTVIPFESARS